MELADSHQVEAVLAARPLARPPLLHAYDEGVHAGDVPAVVCTLLHAGAGLLQQSLADISSCFKRRVDRDWGTDDLGQLIDELFPIEVSRKVPYHPLRHGPLAVPAPARRQPGSGPESRLGVTGGGGAYSLQHNKCALLPEQMIHRNGGRRCVVDGHKIAAYRQLGTFCSISSLVAR